MMGRGPASDDTGAMPTTALPTPIDRRSDLASRIGRAWVPIAVFGALALVYLALDVLAGRLAASVVLASIGTLAIVTPVGALACRRIVARRWRVAGAAALSIACAAMWGTLMLLYFSGDRLAPDRAQIFRAAASAAMLYFPALWLACGGLRLDEPTGALARLGPRSRIAIAAVEAVLWVVAAYAIIHLWASWGRQFGVEVKWGPLSSFVFEAAVLLCAVDAVRAVRRGPWYVLVPVALVALRVAWIQWWMLQFDFLGAMMSH
jgi:hypothetical protein